MRPCHLVQIRTGDRLVVPEQDFRVHADCHHVVVLEYFGLDHPLGVAVPFGVQGAFEFGVVFEQFVPGCCQRLHFG